jgi:hypothetical protein
VAVGVAEGAAKGVERAHSIGAELGAVSGGLERDQSGGGSTTTRAAVQLQRSGGGGRKGCSTGVGGGCPFYSHQRWLARAAHGAAGGSGGSETVGAAEWWWPVVSDFFPNLSKTGLNLKIKMDVLLCSKNFQFLCG